MNKIEKLYRSMYENELRKLRKCAESVQKLSQYVAFKAWSYYIEGITEKFSVDCCNHHMAGINNIARIKKYGDIKEIKRA